MERTIVVNVKTDEYDINIGRTPGKTLHFGNPFPLTSDKPEDRQKCIQRFSDWLFGRRFQDLEPERRKWIIDNLHKLKGKRLGCYCKPLDCHGDVYAMVVNNHINIPYR